MKRVGGGAGTVLLMAAIGWSLILAGMVGFAFRGDPRGFFSPGAFFAHPPEMAGARLAPGFGYDGQFYFALTLDPLLLRPETPGFLDLPPYRAGRIGLPLAAWALVLGNRPAASLAYLALCWLLGLLGIWVVARWIESEGTSPWRALPLVLSAGLVASMTRATPDAAAASLLVLALWLEARRRPGAVAVLAAAVLVRETSFIAAGALAIVRWREGQRMEAVRALAIPAGLALGWRAWMLSRPGVLGGDPLEFGPPLTWIWTKSASPWTLDSVGETLALTALALAVAALVPLLPRWRRWSPTAWTYAGFVLLALLMGAKVYEDRGAFARATCALPLLALPLAAGEDRPGVARMLRGVPLAWAVAGAAMLLFLTRIPAALARLLGF